MVDPLLARRRWLITKLRSVEDELIRAARLVTTPENPNG